LEMATGGKRSTICPAMRSHTPKTPMTKVSRRKVEEALLADRMGLHEEWVERWEQGGKWLEESIAPARLPPFIRTTLSREKVYDVEGHIRRLEKAGCRRPVLYFCLQELSPEAAAMREERRRKLVPGIDGESDLSDERTERRPLANREDMEAVRNKAEAARGLIDRYQQELLLVADTKNTYIVSGNGDVIEPDEGVASIGSGGPFATAAATALLHHTKLGARQVVEEAMSIAGKICIYTNENVSFEELG